MSGKEDQYFYGIYWKIKEKLLVGIGHGLLAFITSGNSPEFERVNTNEAGRFIYCGQRLKYRGHVLITLLCFPLHWVIRKILGGVNYHLMCIRTWGLRRGSVINW